MHKRAGVLDMLKFIGSIFIITATTCIGFSKSNEMRCHLYELEELKKLFYGRMIEKKSFFADNTLIKNSYFFACIMIENLVK